MNTQYQLNIFIHSFILPTNIIKPNDEVRVSITTLPEEQKQNFTINADKMNHVRHAFSVPITKNTTKVIFVFRKKSFFEADPIVASTVLHSQDFPKLILRTNEIDSAPIQNINIYEPVQRKETQGFNSFHRRILGQLQLQLLLSERREIREVDFYRDPGVPSSTAYQNQKLKYYNQPNENSFNLGNGFVDPLYA